LAYYYSSYSTFKNNINHIKIYIDIRGGEEEGEAHARATGRASPRRRARRVRRARSRIP